MAYLDGFNFALQFDGVTVYGRKTGSMSITAEALDATTAESAGDKEYEYGDRDGTVSIGGLYDPDAVEGVSEAIGYINNRSKVTVKWGETETGGKYWTATGLITSVNITGDVSNLASYTIDVQLSGAKTEETVTAST